MKKKTINYNGNKLKRWRQRENTHLHIHYISMSSEFIFLSNLMRKINFQFKDFACLAFTHRAHLRIIFPSFKIAGDRTAECQRVSSAR